jgi:hypothetical protein
MAGKGSVRAKLFFTTQEPQNFARTSFFAPHCGQGLWTQGKQYRWLWLRGVNELPQSGQEGKMIMIHLLSGVSGQGRCNRRLTPQFYPHQYTTNPPVKQLRTFYREVL